MRLMTLVYMLIALIGAEHAFAKSMWKPDFGPAPFPIQVQVMRTSGPGCPAGSIAAVMSPDSTSVSILFDQLQIDLPASPILVQDKKFCQITLGIHFGGQYRVAIVGSDVRGFIGMPAQARGGIRVQHWSIFGNAKHHERMKFVQELTGPIQQNIQMVNRFADTPLWSYCGTQMNRSTQFMTISIEVSGQNENADENAITSIDSFDFTTSPLSYQLAWTADRKNCPR